MVIVRIAGFVFKASCIAQVDVDVVVGVNAHNGEFIRLGIGLWGADRNLDRWAISHVSCAIGISCRIDLLPCHSREQCEPVEARSIHFCSQYFAVRCERRPRCSSWLLTEVEKRGIQPFRGAKGWLGYFPRVPTTWRQSSKLPR